MTPPPTAAVRVFTAEPPGFGARLRDAIRLPAVAARHGDLLRAFVRRDLQARFQGSILGRAWPLLQPTVLFGLYYLVFVSILKLRYEGLAAPEVPLWLFLGVILWNAFATTVGRSTGTIVDNGNLVKKAAFPCELLPLAIALAEGVILLLGVAVYAAGHLAIGAPLLPRLLLLPVLFAALLAFTLGVGLFTSAANVFVRDTANLVPIALVFWMFLTPVFWPASLLAEGLPAGLVGALRANPLFHAVEAARNLAGLYRDASGFPALPWASLGILAAWGAGTLLLGTAYFIGARRRFTDEI